VGRIDFGNMFAKRTNILYSNMQYMVWRTDVLNQKKIFPIEKKLATIEWKLKLLKTSVTTTNTPLRTLKSMIQADVIMPTRERIKKLTDSLDIIGKLT